MVGKMLNNIVATQGVNTADALANWTTDKSFGGDLTMANFQGMQTAIDEAGGVAAYLEQTYGMTLQEIADELGYASTDLLLKSFDEFINSLQ